MEENTKLKSVSKGKDRRQPYSQDGTTKKSGKSGLMKNDLSQLVPPQAQDAASPVNKILSEANKIVKIGMEKEYAILERDGTLQNSNEIVDNLRKNILHLQMEYEKLDQNYQREISHRSEIVKRMDSTQETIQSIIESSNVLSKSLKQLEADKFKIAEFYELIYQNQKEVEMKHLKIEKFIKDQNEMLKIKMDNIKKSHDKIASDHAETVCQLKEKLNYANEKLKVVYEENEKLQKTVQEFQQSSHKLELHLQQQQRLNCIYEENVVNFKSTLKKLKIQRFKYQKLWKHKKMQIFHFVKKNKMLKKTLKKMELLHVECYSTNKTLESKNYELESKLEKYLEQDHARLQNWEAENRELNEKVLEKEEVIESLKAENENLNEKFIKITKNNESIQVELGKVQNEMSKMLMENFKLKDENLNLTQENNNKTNIISNLQKKLTTSDADFISQLEFQKTENQKLQELVNKLETELTDVRERLVFEKKEMKSMASNFDCKFEEHAKTYEQKINNLEKLLEEKSAFIRKLKSQKSDETLENQKYIEKLNEQLQCEKRQNEELSKNLQNLKESHDNIHKQLERSEKQTSDFLEKLTDVNALNKALNRTQTDLENNVANLKKEVEFGKKSFEALEEKHRKTEYDLAKMGKISEENASLKSSIADLKNLLGAAEAKVEAYKVVVKKLESEKVEAKNSHSGEESRFKTEVTRSTQAEETTKTTRNLSGLQMETPKKNFQETNKKEMEISPILIVQKENEPELTEIEKWHKIFTPPIQSGSKKFLSTPRKVYSSTPQPNFRSITPVHKKKDPYEFDSDSSVERIDDNENFRKSELVLIKTASHMTLSSMVENESSHGNSIAYSCINNDPAVAESQFSKLKNWINDLNPVDIRQELETLLFPLLCHLYIEMLRGGHKIAAATFLKKNQSISTEEEAILMLEELASVESTKDIEEKDIIQSLRSSKYLLVLSPATIEILKQYLIRKSHIILLQMINCWFDIEEKKPGDSNALDSEENEPINQPCNGYPEIHHSDGDLAKLEEIIRLVNDVPSTSGPLLLYSILNPDNCMTCGHVSDDTFFLAAGFNTSEIKLWSLTERKLLSQKPCSSSRVRLAVDINETESQTENFALNTPVDSITLRSHSSQVQDLAFIPREDILISVSMDKTMRAWDLKTCSCRATYRGHNYPIWAVDVSPLGIYVATGSHDKTARLWSLERNYPLRIFAGHVQDVDCLRFHPNGTYLATGSSDKSVRLWSTSSGELMRVLPGHRGGIYALSFSPNGKLLASAGEDKRIKIWDIASSNIITELKGHSGTVISLDWSPNGDFLASCSFDNTCRIWHMKHCFSEDQTPSQLPEIHNINCNSLFYVKYSSRNTPICVAGV